MKRPTRNADGSERYTTRGRQWNDGRAVTGPVRTVQTAVAVIVHERAMTDARLRGEDRAARPRTGRLVYERADVWPSLRREPDFAPMPEPSPRRAVPEPEREPMPDSPHATRTARFKALMERRPYVPGV